MIIKSIKMISNRESVGYHYPLLVIYKARARWRITKLFGSHIKEGRLNVLNLTHWRREERTEENDHIKVLFVKLQVERWSQQVPEHVFEKLDRGSVSRHTGVPSDNITSLKSQQEKLGGGLANFTVPMHRTKNIRWISIRHNPWSHRW